MSLNNPTVIYYPNIMGYFGLGNHPQGQTPHPAINGFSAQVGHGVTQATIFNGTNSSRNLQYSGNYNAPLAFNSAFKDSAPNRAIFVDNSKAYAFSISRKAPVPTSELSHSWASIRHDGEHPLTSSDFVHNTTEQINSQNKGGSGSAEVNSLGADTNWFPRRQTGLIRLNQIPNGTFIVPAPIYDETWFASSTGWTWNFSNPNYYVHGGVADGATAGNIKDIVGNGFNPTVNAGFEIIRGPFLTVEKQNEHSGQLSSLNVTNLQFNFTTLYQEKYFPTGEDFISQNNPQRIKNPGTYIIVKAKNLPKNANYADFHVSGSGAMWDRVHFDSNFSMSAYSEPFEISSSFYQSEEDGYDSSNFFYTGNKRHTIPLNTTAVEEFNTTGKLSMVVVDYNYDYLNVEPPPDAERSFLRYYWGRHTNMLSTKASLPFTGKYLGPYLSSVGAGYPVSVPNKGRIKINNGAHVVNSETNLFIGRPAFAFKVTSTLEAFKDIVIDNQYGVLAGQTNAIDSEIDPDPFSVKRIGQLNHPSASVFFSSSEALPYTFPWPHEGTSS